MWAMRIVHEAHMHSSNCFITLTYRSRDECNAKQIRNGHYVPADYSLNKVHFQKFIRKMRKYFPGKTIRYFHCGEYGDENLRPHYHACLFNIAFDDQEIYDNTEGRALYSSPLLEKLWPYGFSTVAELNFETASYTAGYILKKINGKAARDTYLRSDEYGVCYWVTPPYVTMSLKPGIGEAFYKRYKSDFFPSDESPVPGKGIIKKVPRYYENIFADLSPTGMEEVKRLRKVFMDAHREDFTPERLRDKYQCAKARQQRKSRIL